MKVGDLVVPIGCHNEMSAVLVKYDFRGTEWGEYYGLRGVWKCRYLGLDDPPTIRVDTEDWEVWITAEERFAEELMK